CTRLFLGDSSTRLSIKIISLTSKGRGFGLPLEISGENQWFGDVSISRPMKDITLKEIGIYNHYMGFESVLIPSMTSMLPPKASIERLTEDFIVGLEKNYPSTVSTVVRTGSKLSLQNSVNTEDRCAVCLMPRQKGNRNWKNRITVMKIPSLSITTKISQGQK
ncbi:11264_t:CDS:1, partial [Acaulospora colombiana]